MTDTARPSRLASGSPRSQITILVGPQNVLLSPAVNKAVEVEHGFCCCAQPFCKIPIGLLEAVVHEGEIRREIERRVHLLLHVGDAEAELVVDGGREAASGVEEPVVDDLRKERAQRRRRRASAVVVLADGEWSKEEEEEQVGGRRRGPPCPHLQQRV